MQGEGTPKSPQTSHGEEGLKREGGENMPITNKEAFLAVRDHVGSTSPNENPVFKKWFEQEENAQIGNLSELIELYDYTGDMFRACGHYKIAREYYVVAQLLAEGQQDYILAAKMEAKVAELDEPR